MPEPITWIALQTLQTLMQGIHVANGYYTDAGDHVELEPYQLNGAVDQFPVIRVVEDDTDLQTASKSDRQTTMNGLIESYISVNEQDSQLKAHRIRADILRALPTRTRQFPNGMWGFVIQNKRILQRPDGYPLTVVQIRVQLQLLEPAGAS